jgi:hypothetical protein
VDDLKSQLDFGERKGSAEPMVLALDGLGGDVLDLDLASFNEDVVDAVDVTLPAEVLGFRGEGEGGQ